MLILRTLTSALLIAASASAQLVTEPPDYSNTFPGTGPTVLSRDCVLLATGTIAPGDVDWIRISIPAPMTQSVVDLDFPSGSGACALFVQVEGGTTGFNTGDGNNALDDRCGLGSLTTPLGSTTDAAVSIGATDRDAVLDIGITGATDGGFTGAHTENFDYEIWLHLTPVPCTSDADCADVHFCTIDTCNVETGACSNVASDARCDNGTFCDGVEACDATTGCIPGIAPNCDDGVACTIDRCETVADRCTNDPDHTSCDNAIYCDGTESCDATFGCIDGSAPACDDAINCTTDRCDAALDACTHDPDDAFCDNAVFCDGVEACSPSQDCVAGPAPLCNDHVDCTVDQCDPGLDACANSSDNTPCDNGIFCDGAETCDAAAGCVGGTSPNCDDGIGCTVDRCDTASDACASNLDHASCSDNNLCNGQETCDAARDCIPGLPLCGGGLCREADGVCVECFTDVDCDDANACNGTESCDLGGFCQFGTPPCGPSQVCDPTTGSCSDVGDPSLSLDIKPGTCPNRLPRNSRGYLKAAIVAVGGFEIRNVVATTVTIRRADRVGGTLFAHRGPPGPRSKISDVATPFDGEPCACHDLEGDGAKDLVVRFPIQALVSALRLGRLAAREQVELVVSGSLLDGSVFEITDCAQVTGNANGSNRNQRYSIGKSSKLGGRLEK